MIAILFQYFSSKYFGKQFNLISLIFLGVNIAIITVIISVFQNFKEVRFLKKLVLTLTAFLCAAIIVGIGLGEVIFS